MDVLAKLREAPAAGALLDALEREPGVHVVGGAVRDVMLGRTPHELDFVVEGDAAKVARRAAKRLGGEVRVHNDFATATVAWEGGQFDLASARAEAYAHPGALPHVFTPATLEQDLARRDFTVNAMAVSLADGGLTEHPRARQDLWDETLRVLHDRSFVDDPTRLLRLARYEARLAFTADPETDDLARAAIRHGLPAAVSGHRLGDELRLLAAEPQPQAMEHLTARGLGRAVVEGFEAHPTALAHALDLLPDGGRRDLLALASGLLDAPGLQARLNELEFTASDRERILAITKARALASELEQSGMVVASRLAKRLRREPVEAVALAAALGSPTARAQARRWLAELRHVKLDINGDDLLAAGLAGPEIGAGLEAALAARLDGRAPGREEQLAAALASRP